MAGEAAGSVDLSAAMVLQPTQLADWLVVLPVALPIVFGALLLIFRYETRIHATIAVAALACVLGAEIGLFARIWAHGPVVMTMGRWLPPFGISFTADLLGVTFALTAGFVALAAALFALRDIDLNRRRYGFFPFLLLMMAGVDGAFLTGDIFNLYVWFEVFLISSFGLLILGSEKEQIDGATKYAVLNLVGTTLFLIATAYLYGTFGTLNMADIARKAAALRGNGPLMTLAVLFLLAFGMKAAAFPVNFWLPASYHTPRIVTAALFGGVLTKIGMYALLRTLVMILPPERAVLSGFVAWVAAATMILGVCGALVQSDIRRAVGFAVISGVGTMLAGIALGTPLAVEGTILYAVHSMLVMTALYILAGMMKEFGGSFSLHALSGLYRKQPWLAGIALLLTLAVSGLPPGSGLWPKIILVKAALEAGSGWLAFAILLTGFLTSLAFGRIFLFAFWRDAPAMPTASEPPQPGRPGLGYAVLVFLIIPVLAIGLYPEPFIVLAGRAAAGLADASAYIGAVFPAGGPL